MLVCFKVLILVLDLNFVVYVKGFDVGDIPLTVLGELELKSPWTEDPEEDRAPMEYEDLTKIGLKTFNLQNVCVCFFLYSLTKSSVINSHLCLCLLL